MKKIKLPNILLIVLDTCRYDALSCYGHPNNTTPNIDRLASEGTLYENAYSSAPWTLPAHVSIFTGTHTATHRVDFNNEQINSELKTLPTVLKPHGYQTDAFSCNVWISSEFGFDKGYDSYTSIGAGPPFRNIHFKPLNFITNHIYWNYVYQRYDCGARRLNRLFSKRLGQLDRSRPFFTFINYLEPHLKYHPPKEFLAKYLDGRYSMQEIEAVNQDAWMFFAKKARMSSGDFDILKVLYEIEVRYTDYRVGKLMDCLKRQQLYDDTMVIITSDHGDNIGDAGLMDHQYSLNNALIRVPLIIKHPDRFSRNKRIAHPVQTLDIFDTVLKTVGITDEAATKQNEGYDLAPDSTAYMQRETVFSEYLVPNLRPFIERFPDFDYAEYDKTFAAAIEGDMKFILSSDGGEELYDLSVDKCETNNIASKKTQVAAKLRGKIEARLSLDKKGNESHTKHDAKTETILRSLGYM